MRISIYYSLLCLKIKDKECLNLIWFVTGRTVVYKNVASVHKWTDAEFGVYKKRLSLV
jgi:hypothetical protein